MENPKWRSETCQTSSLLYQISSPWGPQPVAFYMSQEMRNAMGTKFGNHQGVRHRSAMLGTVRWLCQTFLSDSQLPVVDKCPGWEANGLLQGHKQCFLDSGITNDGGESTLENTESWPWIWKGATVVCCFVGEVINCYICYCYLLRINH